MRHPPLRSASLLSVFAGLAITLAPALASAQPSRVWNFLTQGGYWSTGSFTGTDWFMQFTQSGPLATSGCRQAPAALGGVPVLECVTVSTRFFGQKDGGGILVLDFAPGILTSEQMSTFSYFVAYFGDDGTTYTDPFFAAMSTTGGALGAGGTFPLPLTFQSVDTYAVSAPPPDPVNGTGPGVLIVLSSASVPEPATGALLASGLVGLIGAGVQRRRRDLACARGLADRIGC